MYKTWITAAFILCYLTWFADCQGDCVYKECTCAAGIISCSYKNLQTIPQLVKTNITGLYNLELGDNKIQLIPEASLPPNLQIITLDNNPIANIDDNAFDASAVTLNTLVLSNIQLTRIPNAFGHLHVIRSLSITSANIVDWNEEVMKTLGLSMQTLYLDNVGMTTWPTWIQNFTHLTELTLCDNNISSIPDNAFDAGAPNLTSLYLCNNSLTVVPKALSKLINLQWLFLQENQIHDVSWLPQTSSLYSLSITNNKISDAVMLSKSLRPLGNSLNLLDINHNQLTTIPDFSFLTKIGNFDLTYNKISDPVSGAMPASTYALDLENNYLQSIPRVCSSLLIVNDMQLSNNLIKSIHATDFHTNASFVDLSYNLLTELADTSFPENSRISSLYLNNNPISYISDIALKNLRNLAELNLGATKITRLPLALSLLTSLYELDVSNCPYLVCTCMESSLRDWVIKFKFYTIPGDCGQTSVYDFFTLLSPSCPTSINS